MFSADFIESQQDIIELKVIFIAMYMHLLFYYLKQIINEFIILQEINEDSVTKLIDFMYTGEIKINKVNVLELIPTSNLLQVIQVSVM